MSYPAGCSFEHDSLQHYDETQGTPLGSPSISRLLEPQHSQQVDPEKGKSPALASTRATRNLASKHSESQYSL